MIRLEKLHGVKGNRQKRKRIGRGESSGHGKTSGRGHKGAGARSGGVKGKGFEGGQTKLARRLPKRGFSNKAWARPVSAINLSQLARFDEAATVDRAALIQAGLISKNAKLVKILGNGALDKKLTIEADAFSASAREKIQAAGGSCALTAAKSDDGDKQPEK